MKISLLDNKKFCGLIIDEMKILTSTVGKVSGFCSIGDVNDELCELEQLCKGDKETPTVASHMGSGGVYGTSLIRFINGWAWHRKSRGLTGCGTGCHGTHFHTIKIIK